MPKIPIYDQKENLTREAGATLVNADSYRAMGKTIEEAGDTMGKLEERIRGVRDLQVGLEAQTKMTDLTNQLRTEMDQDPDVLGNMDVYQKRLNDIKKMSLDNIPGVEQKLRLSAEMDHVVSNTMREVKHRAFVQQVDKTYGSWYEAKDAELKKFVTGDPLMQTEALESVFSGPNSLKAMAEAGIIDQTKYVQDKKKTLDEFVESKVIHDIENSPREALENIKAGRYVLEFDGQKHELDEAQKKKYSDMAQAEFNRQYAMAEKTKKIIQEDNFSNFLSESFDKPKSLTEAQDLLKRGGISPEQYVRLEKYLTSPKAVDAKTNMGTYLEIRNAQVTGSKSPEEIKGMILDGVADGKLSISHAKELVDKGFTGEGKRDNEVIKINGNGLKAWAEKNILDNDPLFPEKAKAAATELEYKFQKRVLDEQATGPRIDEIAKEIKYDFAKENFPELASAEDMPHVVVGVYGKVKRIFDKNQSTQSVPTYKFVRVDQGKPQDKGKKK